jgi:FxsC-like protein
MPNWFFLSHARFDRDPDNDPHGCISRFYRDLLATIRRKRAEGSEGFFDGTGIQQGDSWPSSLGTALGTCRVLICMYSRAYFNSEYCGKEFEVFHSRLERYPGRLPQGVRQPPLILPVLYAPPQDVPQLETILSDIQYMDDSYPEDYRENGLFYMMVRKSQEENYQNFLDAFAERILQVAERYVLPELNSLPDIRTVRSAWELKATPPGRPPANGQQSLAEDAVQYADFVYVAASRSEIQTQLTEAQERIDYYGSRGGLDFKPYYPVPPKTAGLFGQDIATKEGFYHLPVPLSNNLVGQIRDARLNNRIVIIIVDTWTLKIPAYQLLVQQYDDLDPLNSSMLIVWDNKDGTTISNRAALENTIRLTFPVKVGRKEGLVFNSNIGSQSDLEKFLPVALQELKAKIIGVNENFRTAGEGEPVPRLGGK